MVTDHKLLTNTFGNHIHEYLAAGEVLMNA